MIFCSKCVNDIEIIGVIKRLNHIGTCTCCGSTTSFLYDTDCDVDLVESFEDLISIYTPQELLPTEYPKSDLTFLTDELIHNWDIFNCLNKKQVYELITNICKNKYSELPLLFDGPVGIAVSHDKQYLKEKSILRTNKWENFVRDLKSKNRFHTSHINTEILEVFCSYRRKAYKKGTVLYRGRVSSEVGYKKEEMGAPPSLKAIAGRANSFGISCLYLANDLETTIHEVRAGAFDYVSIGKFELQKDVIVVDLRSLDKISPFLELDCAQYAINKEVLKKINREMAKPLRKSDSPLEYLPTQYISEFIKSIEHNGEAEYSGIEYDSTVSQHGYNLAIFNPEIFRCVDVDTYKIEELNYVKKKL